MKMLAHQKTVLQNVCDDKELFKKELFKCLAWMEKDEIEKLMEWLKSNYWYTNREEILAVFRIYTIRKFDIFYYHNTEN